MTAVFLEHYRFERQAELLKEAEGREKEIAPPAPTRKRGM
jgi:hypothetical protein